MLEDLGKEGVSEARRRELAMKAFIHTSDYDTHITSYLATTSAEGSTARHLTLRYGMNPHQKPAFAYTAGSKLPFTGQQSAI